MLIVTAKLKRRNLLLVFLAVAVVAGALLIWGLRDSQPAEPVELTTNEARIAYLQGYGWELNPEPVETLQLLLPDTLSEAYEDYNALQKEQGMDLSVCCGKQVTRYTYAVLNYPGRDSGVQVNLYICENLPVAGDVIAAGEGGFQAGLTRPSDQAT